MSDALPRRSQQAARPDQLVAFLGVKDQSLIDGPVFHMVRLAVAVDHDVPWARGVTMRSPQALLAGHHLFQLTRISTDSGRDNDFVSNDLAPPSSFPAS